MMRIDDTEAHMCTRTPANPSGDYQILTLNLLAGDDR